MAVTNVVAGYGSKFATEAMVNMGFSSEQIMITHVLAGAVTAGAGKLKANKLDNLAKDTGLRNTKELEDILKYKNLKPKEFESLLKNSSVDDILGLSDDTMKFLTKETGLTIDDVNPNNIEADVLKRLKKKKKEYFDNFASQMNTEDARRYLE